MKPTDPIDLAQTSGVSPGTEQEQPRLPKSSQSISTTDLFNNLCDRCCDPIWFDVDDRPKTVLALEHLAEHAPDIVEDFDVLVFAPAPWKYGQLYPKSPRPIVYLAPLLETLDQSEVDYVVAHEFAHHHLGHHDYVNNTSTIEDDADALVEAWGFTVPARRKGKPMSAHLTYGGGSSPPSSRTSEPATEQYCASRKKIFPTEQDAFQFEELQRQKSGVRQHPYVCPFCACWHLSTQSQHSSGRVSFTLGDVARVRQVYAVKKQAGHPGTKEDANGPSNS